MFFRALYLRAEPSARLTALREGARRALRLRAGPDPHLSLLYADLDEERKPAIAAGLGLALPMTIRVDAAEVWGDFREDAVPLAPAGPGAADRLSRVSSRRKLAASARGRRAGRATPGRAGPRRSAGSRPRRARTRP